MGYVQAQENVPVTSDGQDPGAQQVCYSLILYKIIISVFVYYITQLAVFHNVLMDNALVQDTVHAIMDGQDLYVIHVSLQCKIHMLQAIEWCLVFALFDSYMYWWLWQWKVHKSRLMYM